MCGIVRRRCLFLLLVVSAAAAPARVLAQADRSGMTPDALYQAACAACHGEDGKGQPQSRVGFDTPLPDFTDCAFTTPEADLDWLSVIHKGGRIRALDRRMPAFGDVLSGGEIDSLVARLRGFCGEAVWPRGELNFPRPFFTEKAFPENEAVFTLAAEGGGETALETAFLFEQRLGKRAQYEINVPLRFHQDVAGAWSRGIGDINVAAKYALYDNLARGVIVSAGSEVRLPTGRESDGLGGGVAIFEGFGMLGQALPGAGFLQLQAGFEVPADTEIASREVYWRTAVGRTFTPGRWGRAWSPMVELLAAKAVGAPTDWDIVPQLQVSLSGLQHVLLNAGVRIPVKQPESRHKALMVYLLWDWFDGGLASNWRRR
jgi:mono/diheme cytochrome c family protein